MVTSNAVGDSTQADSHPGPAANAYLTEPEVARLLNVEPRTIRLWRRTRGLPHIRLTGKVVRFKPADVDEWLTSRRVSVAVSV